MPDIAGPLLAIDTSTETSGIALFDGVRATELTWPGGRNQTVSILTQIRHLLGVNGYVPGDLGAIGVATGPGSFNGLRVGMSVAKGFSYGLKLPIIGVETLDAQVYPHVSARTPIRAFVAAGRGRAVYADYRYRYGKWVRLSDVRNTRLDDLTEGVADRTLFVGELNAEQSERLAQHPLVVLPSPVLRLRRPSCLAEIAFNRWESGDVDQIEMLEPVYIHGSSSRSSETPSFSAS